MQRGDRYVLFPAVMGNFPWQRCDKRDKKRKEDAMPKKVTLEMKEIQPTIDAYNALDAEIKAELAQLEQKKRNAVYDHVISVFGDSLSPEEVIVKFDRIMNDNRNKGFIEQLKREQAEREKSENIGKISPEDSPISDKTTS